MQSARQPTQGGQGGGDGAPLIPSSVGYSTNLPPSSHTGCPTVAVLPALPSSTASSASFSNSRSTARRRPNSIESSATPAVPACCISWIAVSDSSYARWSLPVRKVKVVRRRSGSDRTANESCVGERVSATGVDLVCVEGEERLSVRARSRAWQGPAAHLFELVQARLRLGGPCDALGLLKRLGRLPVFDHAANVDRDDRVVQRVVLRGRQLGVVSLGRLRDNGRTAKDARP